MRTRRLLPTLLPLALACSGSDPAPTEARPEFAASCNPYGTIRPQLASVTNAPNTTGSSRFFIQNNCTITIPGSTLASSRTGAVVNVGTPNPATVPSLAPGTSSTAWVSYTVGSPGSGTVVLTATSESDGMSSGSQAVTVTGSTAPGGTIGVFPRNGQLYTITPNSHRTTQYQQSDPGHPGPNNLPARGRIKATGVTWHNDGAGDPQQASYTITRLGAGDDASFTGGRVLGDSPVDGTWPWDTSQEQDFHSQTALYIAGGKRWLIEHFAARNKGDGINFTFGARDSKDGSVVRWCVLEDMGDNPISNDSKHAITIYQNYISGVSFYESRPGKSDPDAETYNASHKVVRFDGNLMWLKPKRFSDIKPWNGGALGDPTVQSMFKLQVTQPTFNTQIAFHNNIIRYDGVDGEDQGNKTGSGIILNPIFADRLTSQSNNVVLFPNRPSGFPRGWPTGLKTSFTYLYANAARTRWNQEINAWVAAHPEVTVTDKGLF